MRERAVQRPAIRDPAILGFRVLVSLLLTLSLAAPRGAAQTIIDGNIASNTVWDAAGSPYVLQGAPLVASGVTLTVAAGTVVHMTAGVVLTVQGRLEAIGNAESPVHFATLTQTARLSFTLGASSPTGILSHCIFSTLAPIDGSGPTLWGSDAVVTVTHCLFTNIQATTVYFERSRVDLTGNTMANTRESINLYRCAGVIASNRINQVNTYADGIDIDDAWLGPGDPGLLIEDNVIVGGTDPGADGIDFGGAAQVVFRRNVVSSFGDKGYSIGENSQVVGYNNVAVNCDIGVAIKSGSNPQLSNFTIAHCREGVSCYPDGGSAPLGSATNFVIWDCLTPVFKHITARTSLGFSLIPGAAPWPGEGNITGDPRFVDAASGNYQLDADSPCINAGINLPWMLGAMDLDGVPRILHGTVDQGAFEFPGELPATLTWAPLGATQVVNAPIPVTLTARDAALNVQTGFSGRVYLSAVQVLPPSPVPAEILITEYEPGGRAMLFELSNTSTGAVSLVGWVVAYGASTSDINAVHATLLDNFQETLGPGSIRSGAVFDWAAPMSRGWLALQDSQGRIRDFIPLGWSADDLATLDTIVNGHPLRAADCFSGPAPPPSGGLSLQRIGDRDMDTADDFVWRTFHSFGFLNAGLSLPFPAPPVPDPDLPMSPARTDAFSNGVWRGSVVVSGVATSAFLRASHLVASGDSTRFSLIKLPSIHLQFPTNVLENAGELPDALAVLEEPGVAEVTVMFSSSDELALVVTNAMVVPAGLTTGAVQMAVLDDTFLNGTRRIVVQAWADGYTTTNLVVTVHDDDVGHLGLTLPAGVMEGAGLVTGCVVTVDQPPVIPFAVQLTSDTPDLVSVPPMITLPAGATSAVFSLTVLGDTLLGPERMVTLSARVPGWSNALAMVTVIDSDSWVLGLSVPPTVVAGMAALPAGGRVLLSGTLPTDLEVTLTCDHPNLLAIPAHVIITAGVQSATFSLGLTDPLPDDHAPAATIAATANAFAGTNATIAITRPAPSLELHLPFDQDLDASTADFSTNQHACTVHGATWTADGRYGGAMSFDGINDYVRTISIQSIVRGGEYTLALWFAPQDGQIPNPQYLYGTRNPNNGDNREYMRIMGEVETTPGMIEIGPKVAGAQLEFYTGIYVPNGTSGWHHAVAVVSRSHGVSRFYWNGVETPLGGRLLGSTAFTGFVNSFPLLLAVNAHNGSPQASTYFAGRMDDVRLYSRALRPDEVAALYAGVPPEGPDADGDGMDDAWERTHFQTHARDGHGDWDGDGHSDQEEFVAGTSPTNRLDVLRSAHTWLGAEPAELRFSWGTASGRYYTVMATTNLMEAWTPASNPPFVNVPGVGLPLSYTSPAPFPAARYFSIGVRTNAVSP